MEFRLVQMRGSISVATLGCRYIDVQTRWHVACISFILRADTCVEMRARCGFCKVVQEQSRANPLDTGMRNCFHDLCHRELLSFKSILTYIGEA